MKNIFAIGDIHGMYDEMCQALTEIEKRSPEGGVVVFLGDYIDRGYASGKVLDKLMEGPPSDKWEWVLLRGNHEDMFIEGQLNGDRDMLMCWWNNGGATFYAEKQNPYIMDDYANWLKDNTRLSYSDGHNTYVHAWIKEGARDIDMLWARYGKNSEADYKEYVVHGHTPNNGHPDIKRTRANLDVGSFFTGKLCVGIFRDDIAGPEDFFIVDKKGLC